MWVNNKHLVFIVMICSLTIHVSIGKTLSKLIPEDIIEMQKSGMSSEQIVNQIVKHGIDFEVTLPVLENLVSNGVSDGIIVVLMGQDSSRSAPVKNYIPAGHKQPGVTILTDPSGLELYIDGKQQGVTPGLFNMLKKGRHLIKVEHPLFFTRQEEIDFDGANDIYLKWKMEPREPVVRVHLNVDGVKVDEAWSWIIRTRSQCPGCDANLNLVPWQTRVKSGEAIFLLDDQTKRQFRGSGVACLELNLWQGEVRRDMPLRHLPPPTLRYYISDIQINGIELVDLTVNIRLKEIEQAAPDINLVSSTGFLIMAGDQKPDEREYSLSGSSTDLIR